MDTRETGSDVVVVGGGLAGLAAAALLARGGARVMLLEKAAGAGGRAATESLAGFHLNLGPHALYAHGAAMRVLRGLGVAVRGGRPPASGLAFRGGRFHVLPAGPWSLLRTRLLGFRGRLQVAGFLAALPRRDTAAAGDEPLGALLDREIGDPAARALVEAVARLATYAAEPRTLAAPAALRQIQLALRGVLYVDGGWSSLVEGLRGAAESAGAAIRTGTRAAALALDGPLRGVRLADGYVVAAPAVVLAGDPAAAAGLFGARAPELQGFADRAAPARVASLDVALARLPRPRTRFALGVDRPLYYSLHSAAARLAPPGGAVLHAALYLPSGGGPATADDRAEVESFLERLQPGWRDASAHARWRPNLVAANALPLATQGGPAGRPGPIVPAAPGVFLAGDWVGPEGLLADAALASAEAAAATALAWLRSGASAGRAVMP